jgi:hypothetical protein
MEAKDKAIELFNKYADGFNFDDTYRGYKEQSKKCAIIVVNEIISTILLDYMRVNNKMQTVDYWEDVRTEINKL